MNIPLDNLYHWIRGCATEPVSIYTFSPHGSKNINDLTFFQPEDTNLIAPDIVCHDQEPLNFELTQNVEVFNLWTHITKSHPEYHSDADEIKAIAPYYHNLNFFVVPQLRKGRNIFDKYIILHSEKNSEDVEKFKQTAEPVYYWSHGIIARDWYRFANYDTRLSQQSNHKKTFLVYCRAWTGTREYRLKFLDLLISAELIENCQTSVLHQDQEFNLSSYVCNNPNLQPKNIDKLIEIPDNTHGAISSADYCANDFVSTDISIVLETIAADKKIHLTEKTLRPIACGHPFMLIAGPGSLEYLREYGFKTFSPWIDESYDLEVDTVKRMQLIVAEMKRIECLPLVQKEHMLFQLKEIANYNKNHFFSNNFYNRIHSELVENLNTAISKVKHTRGMHYLAKKTISKKYKTQTLNPRSRVKKFAIAKVLRHLRQNPTTSINQIISKFPPGFFNV